MPPSHQSVSPKIRGKTIQNGSTMVQNLGLLLKKSWGISGLTMQIFFSFKRISSWLFLAFLILCLARHLRGLFCWAHLLQETQEEIKKRGETKYEKWNSIHCVVSARKRWNSQILKQVLLIFSKFRQFFFKQMTLVYCCCQQHSKLHSEHGIC